jgi:hypothetical protein
MMIGSRIVIFELTISIPCFTSLTGKFKGLLSGSSPLTHVSELFEKERALVRGVQLRTAYRVYMCLLRSRAASAKDIQEAMAFSTPAQAKYHLKRLVDLGLAKEDGDATYRATERKFGILRFFFRIRNSVMPMSLFYSAFFGILTVFLFLRSPTIEILLMGALITAKEVADTYTFYAML